MRSLRPRSKKSAALKVILAGISDAYYEIDLAGKLVFFNPVLCDFLGRGADELQESQIQESMGETTRQLFGRLLEQMSRDEEISVGFEWEVVGAGERRVLEASLSVMRDSDSTHVGYRGIIRDITARHEAAEEREAFQTRLLHSQKFESLGMLAGGVAHQFNNLLMSILGYAELIREEVDRDSEAASLVEALRESARRAADLTGQMLAYSGRGTVTMEPCDLGDVIHDIEQLLRSTLGSGSSLVMRLGRDVPRCRGDLLQLRQLTVNLVTNAAEALAGGGRIVIETGSEELTAGQLAGMVGSDNLEAGRYIFLRVAVDGPGIAEPQKIFDPFYTTKFTGRGLGLPAVLGLVRSHGGAIDVASELGVGTTVKVVLPALEDEPAAKPAVRPAKRKTGAGQSVLIVDDQPSVLTVTRFALQKAGYAVLTSDNGREALEIYERDWPTILAVVLDLTMPEMSGEAVYNKLKEINPGVSVILTSGFTEREVDGRFDPDNLVTFLQKPYPAEHLYGALQQVAKQRAG